MCVRQNNNNETTTKMIYIWFRNYLLILDKYRRFLRGLCKLLFVLYRLSRIAWSSYHNTSEWKYKRNEGKIIIERKYINALENCMKRMSEAKKNSIIPQTTENNEKLENWKVILSSSCIFFYVIISFIYTRIIYCLWVWYQMLLWHRDRGGSTQTRVSFYLI